MCIRDRATPRNSHISSLLKLRMRRYGSRRTSPSLAHSLNLYFLNICSKSNELQSNYYLPRNDQSTNQVRFLQRVYRFCLLSVLPDLDVKSNNAFPHLHSWHFPRCDACYSFTFIHEPSSELDPRSNMQVIIT